MHIACRASTYLDHGMAEAGHKHVWRHDQRQVALEHSGPLGTAPTLLSHLPKRGLCWNAGCTQHISLLQGR